MQEKIRHLIELTEKTEKLSGETIQEIEEQLNQFPGETEIQEIAVF